MKTREAHIAATFMSSAIGYQQADSLDVKLANDLGEGRWVDGLYFPATTNVTE